MEDAHSIVSENVLDFVRQEALPCFTDEELRLIFSKIDRSTDKGRRDYAIFLLAVRTGMRASDISGLKLSDICWTEKTIRVVQKKTKVTLLPRLWWMIE